MALGEGASAESNAFDRVAVSTAGGRAFSSGGGIIRFEDYECSRKKNFGDFPSLSGLDLAGRRLIVVEVQFFINPSGVVQKIEILQSSGSSEIDLELVKAFRYWRFEPLPENQIDLPKLRIKWRTESEN